MTKPAFPLNETARLAAVKGLKILDTPPEERFDRLTRLARRIFKVPYSVVSLVDSDRQWFKSSSGLKLKETPRVVSFCGHTILREEIMVIPDAVEDPRFIDNPLVHNDPHIRFYAGVPLSGLGGEKLGALCIMDRRPRNISAEDAEILKDLARLVEAELNNIEFNETIARLQESETRLEDFLENVGDLVLSATPEGRIVYVNRAWKERMGYDDADLPSLGLDEILGSEDLKRRAEVLGKLQPGESLKGLRLDFITKDGRAFPAEATVNLRFKNGKPYYTRAIIRDITERRKIEELKSEAFALASHELRTPLTVMLLDLKFIEETHDGEFSAKTKEFLEMAKRNGEHLVNILDQYLDVSRIESGEMDFDFKPVALRPAVAQIIENIRLYGAQRGIRFELKDASTDAKVRVDAGRLAQVLTNLLTNAAKFSPADGLVSVSLARTDDAASVSVVNQGPGMSKEFQARIFGKFAREHSIPGADRRKGTGLGLSIARAIVEKMNGKIGFVTELGKGTTFHFSVPLWSD